MCAKMSVGNPLQYRYLLLVTCFVHMMILGANLYSVGIYYVSWIEEFKVGSGMTSWIGAVLIGSFTVVAPLSSYLTERLGYRMTCLIGAVVSSSGVLGSAFSPDVYTLLALYGFIFGFGMGITMVPSSSAVIFYFQKRQRILSVGLVTCGTGVGAFLMPYVINTSLAAYGWRGTLLIHAGINLNLFITGALIKTPPDLKRVHAQDAKSLHERLCGPSFRSRSFVLLLIYHSFVAAGISIVYIHISAMTEYLTGVSRESSNLVLSAIGLANLFGRALTSVIANCPCRGADPLSIFYGFSVSMAITTSVLPLFSSYSMVVIWAVCFGFFMAPNSSLAQVVVLTFVDISEVNAGFAYVMLCQSFGYVSGAPIAGALYDATGDYGWSFYLGGACILAGTSVFTWPLIAHCRQWKELIVEEDSGRVEKPHYLGSNLALGFGSMVLVGSHLVIPGDDQASEPMVNGVKKIRPGEV